jgi:hypothetical protein
MRCAAAFTPGAVPANRRAGLTSAPLPILTLALTIGSLPLPLRIQCTG